MSKQYPEDIIVSETYCSSKGEKKFYNRWSIIITSKSFSPQLKDIAYLIIREGI